MSAFEMKAAAEPTVALLVADWARLISVAGLGRDEQDQRILGKLKATQPPPKPLAPVLSVEGNTVSWTALPGVTTYSFAIVRNPATTRDTSYVTVTGTSYTPLPIPGETVNYGVAALMPLKGAWAKEVSITYPAVPSPTVLFSPGLVSGSEPLDLESAGKLGAKIVRLEWDISDPPSKLEPVIAAYAARGIRVAPLAGFYARIPTTAEALNLATWAKTYGSAGTFWPR